MVKTSTYEDRAGFVPDRYLGGVQGGIEEAILSREC